MSVVADRVVTSVSIKPDKFAKVSAICAERGCSKSWFINRALDLFIAECMEDKADYETAASAWKEFEESGEKGISIDELRKKLNV